MGREHGTRASNEKAQQAKTRVHREGDWGLCVSESEVPPLHGRPFSGAPHVPLVLDWLRQTRFISLVYFMNTTAIDTDTAKYLLRTAESHFRRGRELDALRGRALAGHAFHHDRGVLRDVERVLLVLCPGQRMRGKNEARVWGAAQWRDSDAVTTAMTDQGSAKRGKKERERKHMDFDC